MSPGYFYHTLLSLAALAGGAFCLSSLSPALEALQPESARPAEHTDIPWEKYLVVVDAGHGGQDGGTQGFGGLEKKLTLEIARRLEQELIKAGVRVLMTRRDDVFIELEERAAIANRAQASLFVSVHLNADATSAETAGVETYFSSDRTLGSLALLKRSLGLLPTVTVTDHRSERLARKIHRSVCKATGAMDRGVRDQGFVVIAQTECPSVLLECGYLTNATESAKLQDPARHQQIAKAIAEAVRSYLLGLKMNPARGVQLGQVAKP
jgi:N-acetylmuramoyl-L-alanine amidase